MILDGKKIAADILNKVSEEVKQLSFQPVFCDILVGDDPASAQYVKMKGKTAEKVGMKFRNAHYPSTITTEELISEIKKIGQEPNMCGLIVQLPLPKHIDRKAVLDAIDPKIDVDCTGEVNTELFYAGKPYMVFPTAAACMKILESTNVDLTEKKFLVIGRGILVGKPVAFLLEQKGLAYSVMHTQTPNPEELLKNADVVITAIGRPKFITKEKVKPGVIVIDAGTSESEGGISGDVDLNSVQDVASFISPVPGGVGPVTVSILIQNVLRVAQQKSEKKIGYGKNKKH